MTTITVEIDGTRITMNAGIAPPEKPADGLTPEQTADFIAKPKAEGYLTMKVMDLLKNGVNNLQLDLQRQSDLHQRTLRRVGPGPN